MQDIGRWFSVTAAEVEQAKAQAKRWSKTCEEVGAVHRANTRGRDMTEDQLIGIKAEIVTARALGLPYEPTEEIGRPDLGVAELRCRRRQDWGLVLSERDDHKAHYPWVLAHYQRRGDGAERILVRAWAWGHEVYANGSRLDLGGEKQWVVDPGHPVLKPIGDLMPMLPGLKACEAEMWQKALELKAEKARNR